jgi:hypothetical protein
MYKFDTEARCFLHLEKINNFVRYMSFVDDYAYTYLIPRCPHLE